MIMFTQRPASVSARLRALWPAAVACGLLVGCGGDDGPPRADVSGTVTFKGQPVPVGKIFFEPDTAKGNSGPQAFADIKDGKYSTAESGKGVVGGPHLVRISGWDGKAQGDMTMGNSIFVDYRTVVDLPKEAAVLDFLVPESAGATVPKGPVTET